MGAVFTLVGLPLLILLAPIIFPVWILLTFFWPALLPAMAIFDPGGFRELVTESWQDFVVIMQGIWQDILNFF